MIARALLSERLLSMADQERNGPQISAAQCWVKLCAVMGWAQHLGMTQEPWNNGEPRR